MSRREEIDNLLKRIRDDIKSGKMRRFISKDIYSYLMLSGISKFVKILTTFPSLFF